MNEKRGMTFNQVVLTIMLYHLIVVFIEPLVARLSQ